MSDSSKQIHDWQEKVRAEFGNDQKLYEYLFETMDNFYYRYLETTESKNLKTKNLDQNIWGAFSYESSMLEALKAPNPKAKPGIIELAKRVPKSEKPLVRYGLYVQVVELTAEKGELIINSEINWGFPEFKSQEKVQKMIKFKYDDLNQFRKELALKLEEVCTLF